jgi:hypothetical protein
VGEIRGWRPKRHLVNAEDLHWVSILRFVFEFSGARKNFLEGHYDPESTAIQNATLCSVFMGIAASKSFGSFDVQKMRNALSKSKVFATVDVSTLAIGTLTVEMMKFLPFGNIQHTVRCLRPYFLIGAKVLQILPDMIQSRLGSEQLNLVRVQM